MQWFFATNIAVLDCIDIRNYRQSAIPPFLGASQFQLLAASEMSATEVDPHHHLYFFPKQLSASENIHPYWNSCYKIFWINLICQHLCEHYLGTYFRVGGGKYSVCLSKCLFSGTLT